MKSKILLSLIFICSAAPSFASKILPQDCERINSLPSINLIGEYHDSTGPSYDVRKLLFEEAKSRRVLLGTESSIFGGPIFTSTKNDELDFFGTDSENIFALDSSIDWLLHESFIYQHQHLFDFELPPDSNNPDMVMQIANILMDPFGRAAIRESLRSQLKSGLKAGQYDAISRFEKNSRHLTPSTQFLYPVMIELDKQFQLNLLSGADRKQLLNWFHVVLVNHYNSHFPNKVGKHPLVPMIESSLSKKIQTPAGVTPTLHHEQVKDIYNGEMQMIAIRSVTFAENALVRICNADSKFSQVFLVVGEAHTDGVKKYLNQLLGRKLVYRHFNSRNLVDVEKINVLLSRPLVHVH